MASANVNNLDIKKAQREELLVTEAFRRASAVKAYEVLDAKKVQLPAPELLQSQIRFRKKKNICIQLRDREVHGSFIKEDIVSCLDLEEQIHTPLDPPPLLPKAVNVSSVEQQNL